AQRAARRERDEHAALGAVVRRVEKSVLRGGEHEAGDRLLAGQVESRRPARDVTVLDLQVLAAAHIVVARADQEHEVAFRAQTRAKPAAVSSITPTIPTTGVG